MSKLIVYCIGLFLIHASVARAQNVLVARAQDASEFTKVYAELYHDKELKTADVWIESHETTETEKIEFKATSLAERLKNADIRLARTPASVLNDVTTLIFDGYSTKDDAHDRNKGFALVSRFLVANLPQETVQDLIKKFPKSVVYDQRKRPKYFKTLLTRISANQAYPVLAFDVEVDLVATQ